ncbi:MAG: kelch repeat-containing protein [Candidatus Peribacteraceae bacterium]|nr:kelch repeat-containing protein [Candidatus Peribacteraceae bacterium]
MVIAPFVIVALLAPYSALATYYVNDPAECPASSSSYPGQQCPTNICGIDSGILQCYDTSTISSPLISATSNTQYTSGIGGGYIIDCFSSLDSAAPYCDNNGSAYCNRDDSCYSTQKRATTCTANQFGAYTCGDCRSGYQDCAGDSTCEVITGSTNYPGEDNSNYGSSCSVQCDSSYLDCNANLGSAVDGCEIHVGGTCGGGTSYAVYGASCNGSEGSCACSSGYLDCNGDLTVSSGTCEIQVGGSCGTHAVYGAACDGSSGSCACSSGYYDCDASGPDAGNGCEVQTSTTCTTSEGASGTYSGCTCVPDVSNFQTGTRSIYATPGALFQGQNLGTGSLIDIANGNGGGFTVFNSGSLQIGNYGLGTGTGAGTLRWTGTDFEGYDGDSWTSLTSGGGVTGNFVNAEGDTMTGALTINQNNGTVSLSASGSIRTESGLVLNYKNEAKDAVLTFGNDILAETLRFSQANQRFEFSDDVHAEGGITGSGGLTMDGTAIFNSAGSAMNFRIATDNETNMLFVDGTNDRVGIGTASPENTLEVVGTMSGKSLQVTGTGANPLIYTDQTTGRVGIGTTAPNAPLHLKGSADYAAWQTIENTAFSAGLTLKDQYGYLKVYSQGGVSYLQPYSGANQLSVVLTPSTGAYDGGLGVNDGRPYANITTARLYSPHDLIHVNSTAGAGGDLFNVKYSGNVGIGTTSPENTLEVVGTMSGQLIFAQNGISTSGALVIAPRPGTATGNTLIVDTNGLVYDATNKRVGIGTTAPVSRLSLGGATQSAGAQDVYIENSSPGIRFYSTGADGNRKITDLKYSGNNFLIARMLDNGITQNAAISIDIDANVIIPNDLTIQGDTFSLSGGANVYTSGKFGYDLNSYIRFSGGGNTNLLSSPDDFPFQIGGYNSLYLDNNGNVGIGTTSPETKLEVSGTASGNFLFGTRGLATSGALVIAPRPGTNTGNTLIVDTNGLVYDATNKRVGIGTAAPETKLEVVGTVSGSSLQVGTAGIGAAPSGNSRVKLNIEDPSHIVFARIKGNSAATRIRSALVLTTDTNRGKGILMEDTGNNDTWYAGTPYLSRNYQIGYSGATLLYNGNGGGEQAANSGNAYLTVDTAGNVGIGTSAPETKLEVSGTASGNFLFGTRGLATSGALVIAPRPGTATGNTLIVDTKGLVYDATNKRVGIGTAEPSNELHVVGDIRLTKASGNVVTYYGTGGPQILAQAAGGFITMLAGGGGEADISGGGGYNVTAGASKTKMAANYKEIFTATNTEAVVNDDSNDIDFRVESDSSTNALFVEGSSGNVGIGTTAPETKLEVVGSMSGRSLQITGTGASPLIYTDQTTGRVGIGTASPGTTLTVSGASLLHGALTLNGATANISNTADGLNIYKNPSPNVAGSWSTGTAGGTARTYPTSVLFNGKIYSWGGLSDGSYLTTVDIYDIASDSWSTGTAGGTGRIDHRSVLFNGKIYSWGGTNGGVLNTVDIYDIASDSWSTGTAGGTARRGHTSVLFNGKIYSWGGINISNLNTVDIYDIASDSWSTGTAGGTARRNHSSVLFNGKIYSWGGDSSMTLNTVDIYDIASDSWSTGTAGGTARSCHSSVLFNGKIYSWGGYSSGVLNTVNIYDIASDSWSTGTAGGTARDFHSSVLYNGKIYSWGGNTDTSYLNTMDIYDIGNRQNSLTFYENGASVLSIQSGGTLHLDAGRLGITGGNVGIGTTTPSYVLDVQHATSKVNSKNGYLTDGADYAEYFENEENILPGSIVGMNWETGKVRLYRAGDAFVGIASDGRGYVGNGNKAIEHDPSFTLVGLVGQLTVLPEQVTIQGRIVETKDGLHIGFLLKNGKVLLR